MDDFVDPVFSVSCFRAAYEGVIPCITDKSQWPTVNKDFKLQPPVPKPRTVPRQRKNMIPSCLEKGKGKIRRQVKCPRCGGLGHRQSSQKCPLNGTKKRKRKAKNSATKARKKKTAKEIVETPTRSKVARVQVVDSPARVTRSQTTTTGTPTIAGEGCSQDSPGPVTRRRLAMTEATPSQPLPPTKKKLTPKKKQKN